MARFDNKIAVVTGAGSGMGREVSERLAAEGALVIALDLHFPSPAPGVPPNPMIIRRLHDVALPAQWDALASELAPDGVDLLVNAAGVMDHAALLDTDLRAWRRTLAIDLDGVMLGMRALIPLMRRRPGRRGGSGGAIVNFSSVLATVSLAHSPAYHAAKAAVTQLTRNAAVTYAPDNVRVNAVHPGVVATPMVLRQPAEVREAAVARTPLGRLGTPREVAMCVLFMLSDDAAFMTGSAVVVDGGYSAQ